MEKYNIAVELTPREQRVLVGQMNESRNRLIEENQPTEDVDNIILKTIQAKPAKKKWWRSER